MKKKCAIYNRLSTPNKELLQSKREELIKYCKDTLKIEDYVIYEEIASLNSSRHQFEEMMKKILEKEFSDALVYNYNDIYRLNYNDAIFFEISKNMCKAELHSLVGNIKNDKNYLNYKHAETQMEKENEIEY